MRTVDIQEVATRLAELIEETAKGEPFLVAIGGKPLVKVTALHAPEGDDVRRLGFMAGQIAVPEDFDEMGRSEIEKLFGATVARPG